MMGGAKETMTAALPSTRMAPAKSPPDGQSVDRIVEPPGNRRTLGVALAAFTLGFGVWAVFSALGPYLIQWYGFSPSQALLLAAMPPFFATAVSIPLGVAADRYGGRIVFTVLLLVLFAALIAAMFAESYVAFLAIGMLLGLGGASFVVGNAHVSVWFPQRQQGTALGVFAFGNIGIVLGMVLVPLLIAEVLGGPSGYNDLPPKLTLGPVEGWRLVFLAFALPCLIMAVAYWVLTSEPQTRARAASVAQIAKVYKSGYLVWIIAFLYWASFGTLTFFSAFAPTYFVNRWGVSGGEASMLYTSSLVVSVAVMRPVGGWLSDRVTPRRLLVYLFGAKLPLALALVAEVSFPIQIAAMAAFALLSGAAAACVVKLIPTYFEEVGAVSGLAKAAGAACGFAMTTAMAMSSDTTGGYTTGFVLWVIVTLAGLALVLSERPYRRRAAITDERPAVPGPSADMGLRDLITYRVFVDAGRCWEFMSSEKKPGCERCKETCPEIFERPFPNAAARVRRKVDLGRYLPNVRSAIRGCPANAILMVELAGKEL